MSWRWRRNGNRRTADEPGGPVKGNQTSTRALEGPVASLLNNLTRRRARRELERKRQANDYQLALQVKDVFVARGLTHSGFSMAGGYTLHVPEVIAVAAGPPARLDIRTLPGQSADDFAEHAREMAQDLGVVEVRVVTLGRSMIRLELLSRSE